MKLPLLLQTNLCLLSGFIGLEMFLFIFKVSAVSGHFQFFILTTLVEQTINAFSSSLSLGVHPSIVPEFRARDFCG